MATKVNDLVATHLFLKSLSLKYQKAPEHFAALLNTPGARRWLWNYIIENGHDKDYQAIQAIYELASDVIKDAKEDGLLDTIGDFDKSSSPNPYYHQTKKGCAFFNNSLLMTPFGEIRIYNEIIYREGISSIFLTQELIRRLNAVFVKRMKEADGEIFEINISDTNKYRKISDTNKSKKKMNKITLEELENKEGTQNLIVDSQNRNLGIYHIRELQGKKLADLAWYDSEEPIRSWETVKKMWEMLEASRLQEDPLKKKTDLDMKTLSMAIQEPVLESISEVSEWGVKLVEKLIKQPIFTEKSSRNMPSKLMAMNKHSEVLVIEILNAAAKKFLEQETDWLISSFSNPRSVNGKDLAQGIELLIPDGRQSCDINTLKKAYDLVIKDVAQYWVKSKLEDHPAALHTKSEEKYILFVKKEQILPREGIFIRCLSELLGLSKSLCCQSPWEASSTCLYLWIKRDGLQKTLEILNISPQ